MRFSIKNVQYLAGVSRPSAASGAAAVNLVYSFDGSTFNRFSGGNATTTPTEYTIAGWFRPSQVAASAALFARTTSGSPFSAWSHAMHQLGSTWSAYTYDGSVEACNAVIPAALNTWAHVAITAKNSGRQTIYVNGIEQSYIGLGTLWTGGSDWVICQGDGTANNNFSGYACDLAIWLKELTSGEIFTIANANGTRGLPPTVQPASLILFLPMTDAADGQTLSGNWTERQGGLTQTRTGAPVGATAQPSFTVSQITDPFEGYAVGADLNGLNGGYNFAGAFVERWNWVGSPLGFDTFETYTVGAALNGLNGEVVAYDYGGWNGAYIDRTAYLGAVAIDTFESYSVGANLDTLNGGTGYATCGGWNGPYVSR